MRLTPIRNYQPSNQSGASSVRSGIVSSESEASFRSLHLDGRERQVRFALTKPDKSARAPHRNVCPTRIARHSQEATVDLPANPGWEATRVALNLARRLPEEKRAWRLTYLIDRWPEKQTANDALHLIQSVLQIADGMSSATADPVFVALRGLARRLPKDMRLFDPRLAGF